jgi:hypothetical protein
MRPERFRFPTKADRLAFLLRAYFGDYRRDPLQPCVQRAYRDLNRTLHGFAALAERAELHAKASTLVRGELLASSGSRSQPAFDAWHRSACRRLRATYARRGFTLHIGQAQKWINMAFKYVYLIGESEGSLADFQPVYPFAHVPLDSIILAALRPYGAEPLSTSWSRLQDYEEYLRMQCWVRKRFPGCVPLAVEFHLYNRNWLVP